MNHEDMSDGELSRALFNLINGYPLHYASPIYPKYCTDWNAVMPVAVEHRVSLIQPDEAEANWSCCDVYGFVGAQSDNPLRAIVICLIKILESKQ